MDVHHLIMDTCDLIPIVHDKYVYINRSIMIFMIEIRISIIFFFFQSGMSMDGMPKAKKRGYAWLPMNIQIHHLFMDIHHSVMDIRDLKYKYLTAVM